MRSLFVVLVLIVAAFSHSDKDFGLTWGKRARKTCLRMAENRAQRALCESVQEVVEDAFTDQGDQYTSVGVGDSSVTQLWERAESSPWKEAAEGLIEDISEWVIRTGEKRNEKIASQFYQPFMSYLLKLAAEDKQNLEMRGVQKALKNGNFDPEMLKQLQQQQSGGAKKDL